MCQKCAKFFKICGGNLKDLYGSPFPIKYFFFILFVPFHYLFLQAYQNSPAAHFFCFFIHNLHQGTNFSSFFSVVDRVYKDTPEMGLNTSVGYILRVLVALFDDYDGSVDLFVLLFSQEQRNNIYRLLHVQGRR